MTKQKKVVVDFYYDVLSPFSYIAFELLTHHSKNWNNVDLLLKPIFLPALVVQSGNISPFSIPVKVRYLFHDCMCMARYFGIPLTLHEMQQELFQKTSIRPQRLLTAVKSLYPDCLERLSRVLYNRVFVRILDVRSDESLEAACLEVGFSREETNNLLLLSRSQEAKDQLKFTTDEARAAGGFGVPTFVVHLDDGPITLFGVGRLFLLFHYLGYEGPTKEKITPYAKL